MVSVKITFVNARGKRALDAAVISDAIGYLTSRVGSIDELYVACGTASAIMGLRRGHTTFQNLKNVKVHSLSDQLVSTVAAYLKATRNGTAYVFTTDKSAKLNYIQAKLVEYGHAYSKRVVLTGCGTLAHNIEQQGPKSQAVRNDVAKCIKAALALDTSLAEYAQVAIVFGCSHYGYARAHWELEVTKAFG
jgi:glutamate racemase